MDEQPDASLSLIPHDANVRLRYIPEARANVNCSLDLAGNSIFDSAKIEICRRSVGVIILEDAGKIAF